MKLYLMQHGTAVSKAENPERPLNAVGVEEVRCVAAFLGRSGTTLARILHSGKRRAAETAAMMAGTVCPAGMFEEAPRLGPRDSVDTMAETVQGATDDLLVVGHMPFVGLLAARLLAGREDALAVDFLPASVVCLEREDDGGWALLWMIRPDILGY